MTKAVILKELKGMRSFEDLYEYLRSHSDEAKLLGFNDRLPSRRTLSHFYNERISTDVRRIIEMIVRISREMMFKRGIILVDLSYQHDDSVSERTERRRRKKYIGNLIKFLKENLLHQLPIEVKRNSIYSKEDLLNLLLHMAITSDFANNGSKTFGSLSGKTLLYHLRKLEVEEVIESFDKIIDWTYNVARKVIPEFFEMKLDVAIDITDWLYYGDWDDYVIRNSTEKGNSQSVQVYERLHSRKWDKIHAKGFTSVFDV